MTQKKQKQESSDNGKNPAAVALGKLGGQAGRGARKARPPEVMRAAVMKRWSRPRGAKGSPLMATATATASIDDPLGGEPLTATAHAAATNHATAHATVSLGGARAEAPELAEVAGVAEASGIDSNPSPESIT